MKGFSLRYTILTSRLDLLWFPAGFFCLFAIIGLAVKGPVNATLAARAYLGCVVPLMGGVLAAYAVLDDPALELRFTAPVSAAWTLLERLGFILVVQTVCAIAFQVLAAAVGADLSVLGPWSSVQLAWLVPCLALMATGCVGALAGCRAETGALAAGLVWLVELVGRGLLARSEWAQYLLVFMGALMPEHPALRANQCTLLLLCSLFLLVSWKLLRHQERYL